MPLAVERPFERIDHGSPVYALRQIDIGSENEVAVPQIRANPKTIDLTGCLNLERPGLASVACIGREIVWT
jgi:hypothetical protein